MTVRPVRPVRAGVKNNTLPCRARLLSEDDTRHSSKRRRARARSVLRGHSESAEDTEEDTEDGGHWIERWAELLLMGEIIQVIIF